MADDLNMQSESTNKPLLKDDIKEGETKIGFEPTDLLQAPLQTPEVKDKRGPDHHQTIIILIGLIIAVTAIICWPFLGFGFALIVFLISAVFIVLGVLVRFRPRLKDTSE